MSLFAPPRFSKITWRGRERERTRGWTWAVWLFNRFTRQNSRWFSSVNSGLFFKTILWKFKTIQAESAVTDSYWKEKQHSGDSWFLPWGYLTQACQSLLALPFALAGTRQSRVDAPNQQNICCLLKRLRACPFFFFFSHPVFQDTRLFKPSACGWLNSQEALVIPRDKFKPLWLNFLLLKRV